MKIILTENQIKFIVNEQTFAPPASLTNQWYVTKVIKSYLNPINDSYNYRLVKLANNNYVWQRGNWSMSPTNKRVETWGGDNKYYPVVINKDTYTKLNNLYTNPSGGMNLKVDSRLLPLQSDTIKQKYEMPVKAGKLTPPKGMNTHDWLGILQIVSLVVPVVGPFLSAGIGAVDAAMYYSEGKTEQAGLTMALSMLPGISKIPGINNIGSNTIKTISSKIGTNKLLTKPELKILQTISKNKDVVKNEITNFINKINQDKTYQLIKKPVSQITSQVKSNIKNGIFGDYGHFISRPSKSLVGNVIKYGEGYLNYLKGKPNTPASVKTSNPIIKTDKSKKYFYTKNGNDYYWTIMDQKTQWSKFTKPEQIQKASSNWNSLTNVNFT
jgi:hypothetical protein